MSRDRFFPRPHLGDFVAGLGVAVILIPQSLAYAEIAGLPPIYGLFASALPPLAASLVASSPYLQTGPVAMTSLLAFGSLTQLTTPGSAEYIGLAALLALVVGAIRVIIGIMRAGAISYFMSQPMMSGFASAAAILIVATQVPTALGIAAPEGKLLWRAGWSLGHPGDWHIPSLILALTVVALVIGAQKLHPLTPGVLIAVTAGLIVAAFGFDGPEVGDLAAGLPALSVSLPWSHLPSLLVPGGVIALIGFAEPATIARHYAAEDKARWDPDREFIGQGLANLASGVSGGFPVGGSFSRTAINRLSGAHTRWSGAITGFAVIAFFPIVGILEPLPRAVLAGIVIAAVVPLIRPDVVLRIFQHSPAQGFVSIFTFAMVLTLSPRIDEAVLLGIGLGVVIHLVREMRVHVESAYTDGVLRISPGGVLYFGSAQLLHERLAALLADHPDATRLEIDVGSVGRLDYSGAVTLRLLADQAEAAGLEVELLNVPQRIIRIVNSVWEDEPPGLPSFMEILRRLRRPI